MVGAAIQGLYVTEPAHGGLRFIVVATGCCRAQRFVQRQGHNPLISLTWAVLNLTPPPSGGVPPRHYAPTVMGSVGVRTCVLEAYGVVVSGVDSVTVTSVVTGSTIDIGGGIATSEQ